MWDKLYFVDATLLDLNGNSILYYPSLPSAVIGTNFVNESPPTISPMYNALDNDYFGTTTTSPLLSMPQLQYILGDRLQQGFISAGEQPTTTLPYLLWTAGSDGKYGFGVDASGNPIVPPKPGAGATPKTDDVTNFDLPADLQK